MSRLGTLPVRGSVAGAWWLAWRRRQRLELLGDWEMLEVIARLRRRLKPHRCPDCGIPHGGIGQ